MQQKRKRYKNVKTMKQCRGGTAAAKLLTTKDLLRNGPAALPICVPRLAVERQRAGRWLEEQPEQGQEQQQTAEAAANDHARAIPPLSLSLSLSMRANCWISAQPKYCYG